MCSNFLCFDTQNLPRSRSRPHPDIEFGGFDTYKIDFIIRVVGFCLKLSTQVTINTNTYLHSLKVSVYKHRLQQAYWLAQIVILIHVGSLCRRQVNETLGEKGEQTEKTPNSNKHTYYNHIFMPN